MSGGLECDWCGLCVGRWSGLVCPPHGKEYRRDRRGKTIGTAELSDVELDAIFSLVPTSPRPLEEPATELGFGIGTPAVLEDALSDPLERANDDETVVSVFADSRIESITICPGGYVRIGLDVEWLLRVIEAGKRICIKKIIGLHLSLSGGRR
jgi:hypothetical protein